MKKVFFAMIITFNLIGMQTPQLTKERIKELFSKKIEWNQENHITITTATIDNLPDLTTIHAPSTMQKEFDQFFDDPALEHSAALQLIAIAIEQGACCKKPSSYNKDSKLWPITVKHVAYAYIRQEPWDCCLLQ